jgi:hypothetical protein
MQLRSCSSTGQPFAAYRPHAMLTFAASAPIPSLNNHNDKEAAALAAAAASADNELEGGAGGPARGFVAGSRAMLLISPQAVSSCKQY